MNGKPPDLWHKGSRYWRIGAPLVVAVILLAGAVLWWRPEYGAEALEMMGLVMAVFLGGAGAKTAVGEYNRPRYQERYPDAEI